MLRISRRRPHPRSRRTARLALVGALLVGLAVPLTAAPEVAVAAPGDAFNPALPQVFVSTGDTNTTLYRAEVQPDGSMQLAAQGAAYSTRYNAIAANTLDGYVYAVNQQREVIRIGQGGVQVGGPIATIPGTTMPLLGAIVPGTNTYYVARQVENAIYRVNVATGVVTTLPFAGGGATIPGDFVFSGGYLWGVGGGTLYRIDPVAGTLVTGSSGLPAGAYGSIWRYGNGNLGVLNNNGQGFQVAIDNPASASPSLRTLGTFDGPASTYNDGTNFPGDPVDLGIVKDGPARYSAGRPIQYTLTVTNHSARFSSGALVTDAVPAAITGVTATSSAGSCTVTGNDVACNLPPILAGDTVQITVTGTVAAGASGTITNPARVIGNEQDPNPANDTDDTSAIKNDPAYTFVKSVSQVDDVDASGQTDLGDLIWYEFVFTNTGNVALTAPTVTDAKLADAGITVTCPAGPIAPGASVTCAADAGYPVSARDVDAGQVRNSATGTTEPPPGVPPATTPPPSTTTTPLAQAPAITLTKTVSSTTLMVGQELTYSFTAVNSGDVTLEDVTISETSFTGAGPMSAFACSPVQPAVLAPGAAMTCTATYTPVQADVDAGSIVNEAIAEGTTAGGTTVDDRDTAQVPGMDEPAFSFRKRVASVQDVNGNGQTDLGDLLRYEFVFTNTGNLTLSAPTVTDPLLAAAGIGITCPAGSVAPAASTTCTADAGLEITQQHVDAGRVANSATGEIEPPPGHTLPPSPPSTTVTPVSQTPAITLVKGVGSATFAAGDLVGYTFTATNSGNVTLTDVRISETAFTGTGAMGALACTPAQPATLAPGDGLACTASYTATQADVDRGVIDNDAEVTANPPQGPAVTATDDATTSSSRLPAASFVKRASQVVDVNGNDRTDTGDVIWYEFTFANTGNVTLTAPTVADAMLAAEGITISCPAGPVAPGRSVTCTADAGYVVTLADTDNGSVDNSATGSITPPPGLPPVTPPPSTVVTPTDPAPGLSVVKTADRTELVAGQTITYTITATNSGNVTLSDVRITDAGFNGAGPLGALACAPAAPATLAPGGVLTCTATYVVRQADVDRGVIENTAKGTGVPPTGPPVEGDSKVTVPSNATASSTLDKRVGRTVDVNGNGLVDAGDELWYDFELANTGTLSLASPSVTDPMLAAAGVAITCPAGPILPGATLTCRSATAYVVTQADVDRGEVANTAFGTTTPPVGPPTDTPPDTVTTPTAPKPGLSLVKTADRTDLVAGETVTYTFVATNTGNTSLNDVRIEETSFEGTGAMSALSCAPAQPAVLRPGQTLQCSATYRVTAADVDRGSLENVATGTGRPPGRPPVSDEDRVNVPGTPKPGMTVEKRVARFKDANGDDRLSAGEKVIFEFEVANTGNVSIHDPVVDDQMLDTAHVAVTCPTKVLAPGATTLCTSAAYTVTKADEGRGRIVNVATVSGDTPGGEPVVSSAGDEVQVPVLPEDPQAGAGEGTEPKDPASGPWLPNAGGPALALLVLGLAAALGGAGLVRLARR